MCVCACVREREGDWPIGSLFIVDTCRYTGAGFMNGTTHDDPTSFVQ